MVIANKFNRTDEDHTELLNQFLAFRKLPLDLLRYTVIKLPTSSPILKVQVEIEQKHIAEFLAVMKVDVDGSRSESGCLRFDLLHDKETSNKFVFYESYKDTDAFEKHKETPHYKAWADFKSKGHVINQSVLKLDGIDFQYS